MNETHDAGVPDRVHVRVHSTTDVHDDVGEGQSARLCQRHAGVRAL